LIFTGSMQTLSWLFALSLILMAIVSSAATVWVLRERRARRKALPTDWDLTARAVFNTDERRVYRQLRDALPNHIVLAKLPLLRFSQAEDPQRMKYWYQVLGQLNVTFAICGANGRLLAALDLDNGRSTSSRTLKIKQSVLAACRVRYLRVAIDHLPSIAELQLLVPQARGTTRAAQARMPQAEAASRVAPAAAAFVPSNFSASTFSPSTFRNPSGRDSAFSASSFGASPPERAPFHDSSFGDSSFEESSFQPMPSRPAASRVAPTAWPRAHGIDAPPGTGASTPPRAASRAVHTPLWQDSSFFQDSFFGSDDRPDLSLPTDFGGFDNDLLPPPPAPSPRRTVQPGWMAGGNGLHGAPSPASRAAASSRRPMRGRSRLHGDLRVSDTDIVGVVVDTHDAHRPAARRLIGHRDID
jgi:hypothetical protein